MENEKTFVNHHFLAEKEKNLLTITCGMNKKLMKSEPFRPNF
jgi:hypothetical protein